MPRLLFQRLTALALIARILVDPLTAHACAARKAVLGVSFDQQALSVELSFIGPEALPVSKPKAAVRRLIPARALTLGSTYRAGRVLIHLGARDFLRWTIAGERARVALERRLARKLFYAEARHMSLEGFSAEISDDPKAALTARQQRGIEIGMAWLYEIAAFFQRDFRERHRIVDFDDTLLPLSARQDKGVLNGLLASAALVLLLSQAAIDVSYRASFLGVFVGVALSAMAIRRWWNPAKWRIGGFGLMTRGLVPDQDNPDGYDPTAAPALNEDFIEHLRGGLVWSAGITSLYAAIRALSAGSLEPLLTTAMIFGFGMLASALVHLVHNALFPNDVLTVKNPITLRDLAARRLRKTVLSCMEQLYRDDRHQFISIPRIMERARSFNAKAMANGQENKTIERVARALSRLEEEGRLRSKFLRGRYLGYQYVPPEEQAQGAASPLDLRWHGLGRAQLRHSAEFLFEGNVSLRGYVSGRSLTADDADPYDLAAQAPIAHEAFRIYRVLQLARGIPLTTKQILDAAHGSGDPLRSLTDAYRIRRALEWLDLKGFPIRREIQRVNGNGFEPIWVVRGAASRVFFNLDGADWSDPERLWQRLPKEREEAPVDAIILGKKVLMLKDVRPFSWEELVALAPASLREEAKSELAVKNQMIAQANQWASGRAGSDPDTRAEGKFDGRIAQWAATYGIEASWLRWNEARVLRHAKALRRLPTIRSVGERIRLLRQVAGLSERELAELIGVKEQTIWWLEAMKTTTPSETRALPYWPLLAEALDVDPILLFTGQLSPEALAARTPQQRVDLLRWVRGWELKEWAIRLGIALATAKKYSGNLRLGILPPPSAQRDIAAEFDDIPLAILFSSNGHGSHSIRAQG